LWIFVDVVGLANDDDDDDDDSDDDNDDEAAAVVVEYTFSFQACLRYFSPCFDIFRFWKKVQR
jgi:hypothetical protein